MKKVLYIIILLFYTLVSSQIVSNSKINFENLYGKWIFLNFFKGEFKSIGKLSKDEYQSNFGTPFQIYEKSGQFMSNQGDYSDRGKFLIDKQNKIIKEIYNKGDTLKLKVKYLTERYLVLSTQDNYNYFYRKN
ncbi:hypothetical protein SAMN05421847_2581 [Halpernia humi]|uniref:Lipocalin-like domain-containing protein n=1 Tax=Halpernia humi TaxID=493375 RepID=A0A1H6ASW3_9FLAO|nr:hypothetical protein [Halpernia humi]SEG51264.1 hypothetical protein SAMN05421847_2581 [Halpernia humi]